MRRWCSTPRPAPCATRRPATRRPGCGTTARCAPLRATGPLLTLDPDGSLLLPGDAARRRATCCSSTPTGWPRPAPAGSCSARSASPASSGATRARTPTTLCKIAARGGPGLRRRAAHRRRRHPGRPPDLTGAVEPMAGARRPELRRGAGVAESDRPMAARATDRRDERLPGRRPSGRWPATSPRRATSWPGQGKLFVRDRLALLLDEGSFVEDALLANALAPADDLPADGVVTGGGTVDGRPVCVMANDPTVKAGLVGRAHRREDRAPHRVRPAPRAAGRLAGRLGRGPHHRSGRAVPRPAGRGPHLLQPGPAVGPGAADLLPVRPVGRRRRLHPELLRHRDHGRGQRLDVPGLAPHGRDGDRREHHARGDGRRPHARHGVGLRRQPGRRRRRRHRPGPRLASRTSRPTGASRRPVVEPAEPGTAAHRRP